MAILGTIAQGFNITNIWGTMVDWWNAAFIPMFNAGTLKEPGVIFAFIGGTIWTAIVVAPIWYLWKGTGIIFRGKVIGLVFRILFIMFLYFVPTLFCMLSQIPEINMKQDMLEIVLSVFNWTVIGLALLGVWLKS